MSNIDHNMMLYRMGEGSIGGKARGLAFLNSIIVSRNLSNVYKNITVKIPKTVFIGTDYFDDFIAMNSLQDAATGTYTDAEIFTRFINAHLPQQLMWNLRAYLTAVSKPLAVRSSSKLEDSYYQPFAGIYATHMVPFTTYTEKFLADVSDAIKAVYASVFMQESKAYIEATSNVIDEEKMAVVLQEVCGNSSGNMQYPLIAGVIRSVNFYPVGPEKAEDGIVSMAVGLGKYVVDNEPSLRFSPACPLSALQGYSADSVLKESQKYFYALDTDSTAYRIDPDEKKNFIRVKLKEASDAAKSLAVSVYDPGNQMITDMPYAEGTPVVTFSKLFRNNDLNFTQLLSDLIQMGKEEMNSDVELEFALEEDAEKKGNYIFNLLQIRPVGTVGAGVNVEVDVAPDQCILYSRQSLGNGIFEGITDVVYVKTESFDPSSNAQLAVEIERINHEMKQQKRSYVLIGPGRWGSSDPWLGIPVKWSQISEASVIAEIGLDNYPVEPSQGTHFFQNITTFCIGYMIVSPQFPESIFDHRYLGSMKPVSESEHIRQIRFPKPLRIIIDGRKNTGAIVKP